MEYASQSFDESTEERVEVAESQDSEGKDSSAEPSNDEAIARSSDVAEKLTGTPESTEAAIILVLGEHRFSHSYKLRVLTEHPEALEGITSTQCLSTSAFIKPALHAAMAELLPSMMVQVTVRLIAITLLVAVEMLPSHQAVPQDQDVLTTEQTDLYKTVRHELEQALPYYGWQGPGNYCGRVQYLMALLEEVIRVLAVPTGLLVEALKADKPTSRNLEQITQWTRESGESLAGVFGTWATKILLPAWGDKAIPKSRIDANEGARRKHRLSLSTDPESEAELMSPSKFVRRESRLQNVVKNVAVESGSLENDPICDSDVETDLSKSDSKIPGYSRHHLQDNDILNFRKRRMRQSVGDNKAVCTDTAKRRKIQ